MKGKQLKAKVSCIINGKLLRNRQWVRDSLWIKEGKFIEPQKHADEEFDVKGLLIVPGFIDLQVNGAFGYDFTLQPESVDLVRRQLPRFGVTSFLPTVITTSLEQYRQSLPLLQPRRGSGAEILGIHLEGPCFNPLFAGAHPKPLIRPFDLLPEACYGTLAGVKMVTLAPELPGAASWITALKRKEIVVAAGHSNATVVEAEEGIAYGISVITHLFNAMRPFGHREPGLVGVGLTTSGLYCSVIADGLHLHPRSLKMAWQANPESLFIVTDAMSALGLPPGNYELGGVAVEVSEKEAHVAGSETLAGSVCSMDQMVRSFKLATGCSLIQAVEAATLKPAIVLGLQHKKGSLDFGADADFLLMDDEVRIYATYIAGECIVYKEPFARQDQSPL